jgi:heme O synthase-like polyprenyltransferase
MKPTDDEDERLAAAQIVANRVRPTTFALAALIFGIAGVSALWLFVVAGLAVLCSLSVALIVGLFRNYFTAPHVRRTQV